jgi:hypothetical protein
VDVPGADRTPKQQTEQMAAVARRDGSKQLASDTRGRIDLRGMSKHDLRAELERLNRLIDDAPGDQSRLLADATTRREHSEQRLAEATSRHQDARDLVALIEHGPARWLRRGDLARAREQARHAEEAKKFARQAAGRAADRERHARQAQQQHHAHREANPDLDQRRRELLRVQAWRKCADAHSVELLHPEWSRDLGERPATVKDGRAWDRAVEQTIEYRQRWNITDAEHLGRARHQPEAALWAVVDRWRAGQLKGLELGGIDVEEARSLGRAPVSYLREQLRQRLARQISRQHFRWLHPTSRRHPDEALPPVLLVPEKGGMKRPVELR